MFNMYLDISPQIIDRGFMMKRKILKFITVSIFIKSEQISKIVMGKIVKIPDIINTVEIFLNISIETGKVTIAQDKLIEAEEKK